MAHKGIATLASALVLCFFLLSHLDSQFFLLHFYEALIYLVIVLMLFYFHERWAYMLGIVAPAGWLVLLFITGGLNEFWVRLTQGMHGESIRGVAPAAIGALISILSVAMIFSSSYRWRREFSALKQGMSILLVSLGIVSAYYAVLVLWFWKAATQSLSRG
ncbi:MAG: hypothetical protein ACYDCM_09390 [Candidatus Acidiferrales bacterium]